MAIFCHGKQIYIGGCLICIIVLFASSLVSKEIKPLQSIELEKYELFKPDLMVGEGDMLFIWDDANKKIFKFSSNLEFVKSFSKWGEGPGEVVRPLTMKIQNSKLLVFDFKQRLIEFDLDGNYLGENRNFINKGLPRMVTLIDTQRYVAAENKTDRDRGTTKSLFFYSPEGKTELTSYHYEFKDWLNLEKTASFKWCSSPHYIYIIPPTSRYCVISFNIRKEEIVTVLENKEYTLEEYSPEERKQMEKKLSQAKESPLFSQLIITAPIYKSAVKSLLADENDTLYAITNKEKNGQYITDIYDPYLRFKDQITIPKHQLILINQSRIYLVTGNSRLCLKKFLY